MKNYSQTNEQEAILAYINKHQMNAGRLLEIGAFDGENFSNVRAIMLSYPNWSGVFVEPSSWCFTKIHEMYKHEPRRAELVNAAVVLEKDLTGQNLLEFHDAPFSGVSSIFVDSTCRFYKEQNQQGDIINPRKIFVAKVGMKEILDKFGPFDFINIDIEGFSSELALQEWFDPRQYGCKLICIEHDPGYLEALQQRFYTLGYMLIKINAENIIFGLP